MPSQIGIFRGGSKGLRRSGRKWLMSDSKMNRAVWKVNGGQGGLVMHNGISSDNLLEESKQFSRSMSKIFHPMAVFISRMITFFTHIEQCEGCSIRIPVMKGPQHLREQFP